MDATIPPVYLRILWLSRLANRISIKTIAEQAGLTPHAYVRIEKGAVVPDARTWRLICRAVRQPALEDLLDGSDQVAG